MRVIDLIFSVESNIFFCRQVDKSLSAGVRGQHYKFSAAENCGVTRQYVRRHSTTDSKDHWSYTDLLRHQLRHQDAVRLNCGPGSQLVNELKGGLPQCEHQHPLKWNTLGHSSALLHDRRHSKQVCNKISAQLMTKDYFILYTLEAPNN